MKPRTRLFATLAAGLATVAAAAVLYGIIGRDVHATASPPAVLDKLKLTEKVAVNTNWFLPWSRPTVIEGSAAEVEKERKAHPALAPTTVPKASQNVDPLNVAWHYGSPGMSERPIPGTL